MCDEKVISIIESIRLSKISIVCSKGVIKLNKISHLNSSFEPQNKNLVHSQFKLLLYHVSFYL